MGTRIRYDYFSEAEIALSKEIGNHPALMELLSKHPPQEKEIRLAEIAAYCDVVLDGSYSEEEIERLCGILYRKLKLKDSGIILLH